MLSRGVVKLGIREMGQLLCHDLIRMHTPIVTGTRHAVTTAENNHSFNRIEENINCSNKVLNVIIQKLK